MSFVRFLRSQAREPQGWFGKLFMGRLINRANRRLVENTVTALRLQPSDSVLEIGFGGGAGLKAAMAAIGSGKAYGVDISQSMIEHVKSQYPREIASGKLHVQHANVSHLPFASGIFNGAFAVNNIYFWDDPLACLQEIRRVLKDGARIAIGNRSKEHMSRFAITKEGFRLYSSQELEEVLRQAGFRDVTVEHKRGADKGKFPDEVIGVATRNLLATLDSLS